MLQVALLLFGCVLSRYLWDIDITVASVIIGVTSFGPMFYAFITVAGMVSASCPYQTPGSHILRYLFRQTLHYAYQNLLPSLHSAPFVVSACVLKFFASIARKSMIFDTFANAWLALEQHWYSVKNAGTSTTR